MKVPEGIKKEIEKYKEQQDWEVTHSIRDDALISRLEELDPEFVEDLESLTKDTRFWFA